jgi:uncharacterized PurR-regulated membrane protein YhhQ (DUF165 family)
MILRSGREHTSGVTALAAFGGAVGAANLMSVSWLVPVGFGLHAPSGVYLAGLTFALRDLIHDQVGLAGVLVAVAIGAGAAGLLATSQLAIASATAFAVSELVDTAVYAPLRRRGRPVLAVALSNLAGLAADSTLFVWLAFGTTELLAGQVLGKTWITLLVVPLLSARRRWLRGRSA